MELGKLMYREEAGAPEVKQIHPKHVPNLTDLPKLPHGEENYFIVVRLPQGMYHEKYPTVEYMHNDGMWRPSLYNDESDQWSGYFIREEDAEIMLFA